MYAIQPNHVKNLVIFYFFAFIFLHAYKANRSPLTPLTIPFKLFLNSAEFGFVWVLRDSLGYVARFKQNNVIIISNKVDI